ncbi:hypothetical protein K431DRAFT_283908 [Polychaeton citri CBS 116435]|uniref:Synaptobrevin n=1 Tax=Polychaeton citri CBS 116435 TaxID=1314669 RepID=A0A9P4QCM9_9PEZI|nr:hypothetical protein K431DRAFT_283908 [Polychaeton citri CBS 116435]
MDSSLSRLLSKLEVSISNEKLASSPYERKRVQANLDSARAILLSQEKQASTIQIQNKRQQAQADLQQKRDQIKALSDRVKEIQDAAVDEDSDEDDSDTQEAMNNGFAPAIRDVDSGIEAAAPSPQLIAGPASPSSQQDATPNSELRSRRAAGVSASDNHSAASTTALQQLFAGRSSTSQQQQGFSSADPNISKHEQLISHNRTTQESLTTSLLGLAQALKESSNQFSSSLQAEKEVLSRAESSLEGSSKGMEAAERRMGTLRKMSEGQGWLGRLKLYGMIGGLWVACFLIVFIGPKLRF